MYQNRENCAVGGDRVSSSDAVLVMSEHQDCMDTLVWFIINPAVWKEQQCAGMSYLIYTKLFQTTDSLTVIKDRDLQGDVES